MKVELKLPVAQALEDAYNCFPFNSDTAVVTTGLLFMAEIVEHGDKTKLDELYKRLKEM